MCGGSYFGRRTPSSVVRFGLLKKEGGEKGSWHSPLPQARIGIDLFFLEKRKSEKGEGNEMKSAASQGVEKYEEMHACFHFQRRGGEGVFEANDSDLGLKNKGGGKKKVFTFALFRSGRDEEGKKCRRLISWLTTSRGAEMHIFIVSFRQEEKRKGHMSGDPPQKKKERRRTICPFGTASLRGEK